MFLLNKNFIFFFKVFYLNDLDLKICKIFCIDLYNETIVKNIYGFIKYLRDMLKDMFIGVKFK